MRRIADRRRDRNKKEEEEKGGVEEEEEMAEESARNDRNYSRANGRGRAVMKH